MCKRYFTSESVARGHPDKLCDQIADRLLDDCLVSDPNTRMACEVICTGQQVHIFGELDTEAAPDYEATVRNVLSDVGYTLPGIGFDADDCKVYVDLQHLSPDVACCLSRKRESEKLDAGAGDQATVFGYACNQTESLMPLPIELAHAVAKRLEHVRVNGKIKGLLPDGKVQVTVEYDDDRPVRVSTVAISAQHRKDVDIWELRKKIRHKVIQRALPPELLDDRTTIFINPTGKFNIGGPAADSGLTGRKLAVDCYGGYARCGGGAISGKDGTKTNRSGAYLARYIAKNIVAAGYATHCEVLLSYAIGLVTPTTFQIETFGTETVPLSALNRAVLQAVDFRPMAIIQKFGLTAPIFSRLSCYGHFGSNAAEMPWEQTDLDLPL